MTPRERILTALNHEPPDRTPTDGWFHPEVVKSLKDYFNTTDWSVVLGELGIEGWSELVPSVHVPEFESRVKRQKEERQRGSEVAVPLSFSNRSDDEGAYWLDNRTYEDCWGVRYRLGDAARYQQWISGPLQGADTVAALQTCRFPTSSNIREPDNYTQRVAALKAEGSFVTGEVDNPFKRYWLMRGLENALMDYLSNPDVLEAAYDRLYAFAAELCLRMARAGLDMIKIVGDVAMQNSLLLSPGLWRRFDKPRLATLIGACRAISKDVVFFFHSDGNLTDLMDDLIDVGFTVINPIQPECMDPANVKRRWGDRITLHGGISIQRTLPFGSTDEVRREVEDLIRSCGYNGGLILMPSNDIQPDTPIENILVCYSTARHLPIRSPMASRIIPNSKSIS